MRRTQPPLTHFGRVCLFRGVAASTQAALQCLHTKASASKMPFNCCGRHSHPHLDFDSRNGVVTAESEIQSHYRDIWHLLSADILSYLGADVEISCPGLLANSTSRNGGMDHSCPERQDHVPPLRPTKEANCQVPRVPQPPAVATRISHYASNYVLGPVSGVLLVRTRV